MTKQPQNLGSIILYTFIFAYIALMWVGPRGISSLSAASWSLWGQLLASFPDLAQPLALIWGLPWDMCAHWLLSCSRSPWAMMNAEGQSRVSLLFASHLLTSSLPKQVNLTELRVSTSPMGGVKNWSFQCITVPQGGGVIISQRSMVENEALRLQMPSCVFFSAWFLSRE